MASTWEFSLDSSSPPRQARPESALGAEVPIARERGLALAGDTYSGGRVEDADLSFVAAARRLD